MKRFDHVAIDGPAASGKTTAARLVARRLGYLYLDTGAMYRALAYLALMTETDLDNEAALVRLAQTHPIRVELAAATNGQSIFAGDHDVTDQLSSSAVTAVVSTVAAHPRVREAMVREQRRIANDAPVVMAGRDIGTVVLPDAPHKIFLTASVDARVQRRGAEMQAAGVDVSARKLRQEIEERDRLDQSRATSPLRAAKDAIVIDSTQLSADEVAEKIVRMVGPSTHRQAQGRGSSGQAG
ncbi:MAG: (d)CMP kinase [Candidatus Eremiobacteraeota bacterium]|nr:(d)CMP kinase [Candidatus Eremiobacteraeota bacterium]